MKTIEKKLFYFLLNRWANRNDYRLKLPNGVVCLTKDFHLQIKPWRQS